MVAGRSLERGQIEFSIGQSALDLFKNKDRTGGYTTLDEWHVSGCCFAIDAFSVHEMLTVFRDP